MKKGLRLKADYLLLLFFMSAVMFSCREEQLVSPAIPFGYEYFPVNTGHSVVYNFDSVFIDSKVGVNDTTHYQLKEIIESTFTDNTGRPTLRIERYRRNNDSASWNIKNVYFANVSTTSAEKVEENQRLVKLVFPVKLNKSWSGNAFTSLPKWEYEYTGVDEPLKIGSQTFDSTLTVTQIDELNLIEKDYSVEKFAKHVGLVYRQNIHLEKTPAGVITRGSVITYTFKSYLP